MSTCSCACDCPREFAYVFTSICMCEHRQWSEDSSLTFSLHEIRFLAVHCCLLLLIFGIKLSIYTPQVLSQVYNINGDLKDNYFRRSTIQEQWLNNCKIAESTVVTKVLEAFELTLDSKGYLCLFEATICFLTRRWFILVFSFLLSINLSLSPNDTN